MVRICGFPGEPEKGKEVASVDLFLWGDLIENPVSILQQATVNT